MRVRWTPLAIALFLPGFAFACGLDDTVIAAAPSGSAVDGGGDSTVASDGGDPPGDGGDTNDGGPPGPDAGQPPPPVLLVYANTQTELFSFDVISKTLTHLATFSSCGSTTNQDDLAVGPNGALFLLQKNDAIYNVTAAGVCSMREQLSSNNGSTTKISGRGSGVPQLLALNGGNNNLYSVDPTSGTTTEITGTILPDNGVFDFTCSDAGTCWGAFDHNHCSAGSSSSCLYSFPDDGGTNALSLGALTTHPAGLAYANGTLYSFGDDGTITSISLTGTPTASTFPVNFASGTTMPPQWYGAGSQP